MPNSTLDEIERLTYMLLKEGLAIDINKAIFQDLDTYIVRVTWGSPASSSGLLTSCPFATLKEYRMLIESRQFSAVLFDGSIIQISYTFKREEILKHRLMFFPCPLSIDEEDLLSIPLIDIIDSYSEEEFQSRLRLRSPLRFDYDVESQRDLHPASHLTVSDDDCRIPIFAPLSVGHFIRFVFQHFFYKKWSQSNFIQSWPYKNNRRTLTITEEQQLYIDCRSIL